MTENKRYDVIYEKEPRGQVVTDDGIPCTARTCCTRLNRLEEENKQLINDCSILVQSNQEYRKENEQLKNKIDILRAVE